MGAGLIDGAIPRVLVHGLCSALDGKSAIVFCAQLKGLFGAFLLLLVLVLEYVLNMLLGVGVIVM